MYLHKDAFAGGILLLAWIVFATGCGSNHKHDADMPPEVAHANDSASKPVDTTSAAVHGPHYVLVSIKDMKFNPDIVTVQKGDTVAWINNDMTSHCVTEVNKQWTSSPMASGATWQKVVDKSADYYCALHLVMKGKIMVE